MGFPGGSSGKQMQKWKLLSSVDSATLWTITRWVPLSIGFSRQEYWSGFPCPPPGDLPNPGIESRSPTLQEHSSPSEPPGKSQPANVGDIRDGSGRSPRGRQGNPLQDSCLENPMDRGAWRFTVHRVTKSQTWLKRLSMQAKPSKAYSEVRQHFIQIVQITTLQLTFVKHFITLKLSELPSGNKSSAHLRNINGPNETMYPNVLNQCLP